MCACVRVCLCMSWGEIVGAQCAGLANLCDDLEVATAHCAFSPGVLSCLLKERATRKPTISWGSRGCLVLDYHSRALL